MKKLLKKHIIQKKTIARLKRLQSIIRGNRARKSLSSYYLNQILVTDSSKLTGDSAAKRKIFARSVTPKIVSPFKTRPVSSLPSTDFVEDYDRSALLDNGRRSISPTERGTPIRTSNLISMVFGKVDDSDDSSSVYSQPEDSPSNNLNTNDTPKSLFDLQKQLQHLSHHSSFQSDTLDISLVLDRTALAKSPYIEQTFSIDKNTNDDDNSSDDFNLKNVDANSDSDDSFDNDKRKPGSEILSIVSNPDLDNFKEVKYDTPESPPSILRGTLYKGNISSILKDKSDIFKATSSETTVDRQLGVKWAPDVKFKDTDEKRTKEPSEIMYTENPLQSLHVVYTVPLNVIGGIGSAIGGLGWNSSSSSPPMESNPVTNEPDLPKNTNPTTEEILEERRRKMILVEKFESIKLTESYDASPVSTPTRYNKTPVVESSSHSFTATSILKTLFIDPSQIMWSSKVKGTNIQSNNEEADFVFDNIYGEAEPTKLDFQNEFNEHLDFQYKISGTTMDTLKKREEDENIVYSSYQSNDTNITSNVNIEMEKIDVEQHSSTAPSIMRSVDNYHPKRKIATKPFNDKVLKRRITLRPKKANDNDTIDDNNANDNIQSPPSTPAEALTTNAYSANMKPNPNQSPDDFDFQYVHMFPSPLISLKMSLVPEISSRNSSSTNHHLNLLDAIKPKTNPIIHPHHRSAPHRNSKTENNAINLDDWENHSNHSNHDHDDNKDDSSTHLDEGNKDDSSTHLDEGKKDDSSTHLDEGNKDDGNINSYAKTNSHDELNTTEFTINEYLQNLEKREISEADETISSRENSEVGFHHQIDYRTPPSSAQKTPQSTPTIGSAPSAVKILSWFLPDVENGDVN